MVYFGGIHDPFLIIFYWLWFHEQTAALLFWVFTPAVMKCHALERLPACTIVATPVGTCEQQIKPRDAQWDKSCAGKGILSVTYSNKQIHTRSFFYLLFLYISQLWLARLTLPKCSPTSLSPARPRTDARGKRHRPPSSSAPSKTICWGRFDGICKWLTAFLPGGREGFLIEELLCACVFNFRWCSQWQPLIGPR